MIRAFRLAFWFFFGVALVGAPMLAFSAAVIVPVSGVSANSSGQLIYTSRAGIPSIVYPALSTTTSLSVSLPPVAGVPPGRQLMVIPTTINPNIARVAGAVVALARVSGPVGLGLTLLPILCAETKICGKGTTNEFEITKITDPYIYSGTGVVGYYPSSASWCDRYRQLNYPGDLPSVWAPNIADTACLRNGSVWTSYNRIVNPNATTSTSSPTDADFTAAITKLTAATNRMGDIVSGLQAQNQPVPIDKPVLQPTSVTSSPTSTVNRDQAGNIINTTTTTTTTNSSPVTNTSTTNTTNITHVTNTTVTGPTGAVTGTSSTANDPPPPDDPEIQFDTVDDVPLEKQELPLSMPAATSWGEGSCPPDPSVSVLGHPIVVPVHVVCQYMSGVRNAVLALFALISAYIVIGVKFEG